MPLRIISRRDRKVNRLVKRATEVRYRRSQVIFSRGEASEVVYLVRKGHIRLSLPGGGRRSGRTVAVVAHFACHPVSDPDRSISCAFSASTDVTGGSSEK